MTEILPVWNKNLSKFNHNEKIPSSFRMLIIGPSNCGKSVLLLKLLLYPQNSSSVRPQSPSNFLDSQSGNFIDYNNLIIFSKTIQQPEFQLIYHGFNSGLSKSSILNIFKEQNSILNNLSISQICQNYSELYPENENNKINVTMSNKFQDMIPCEQLDKNKTNLIVFDDCVNDRNQEIMESYLTKGRHTNCNCIDLPQNYYGLPERSIRGS